MQAKGTRVACAQGTGVVHVGGTGVGTGGLTPWVWTPTTPPPPLAVGQRPPKGGGGEARKGNWGGSGRGFLGVGCPGGSVGGGVQVGNFGWSGGYMPPRPSVGQSQAPLTSTSPPSNQD